MAGPISSEEIERAEFSISVRGYDKGQVDAFVQMVAAEHRRLAHAAETAKNADRPYRSLGEEMGDLLQHAKDSADALRAKAREEADHMIAEARGAGSSIREEAHAEANEIRADAQSEADRTREATEREVANRTGEMEAHLGRLREAEADVRARLSDLRGRLHTVVEQASEAGSSIDDLPPSPQQEEGMEEGQGAAAGPGAGEAMTEETSEDDDQTVEMDAEPEAAQTG